MVAYTFYESDTRVRRYAEALAERGDEVDILALSDGATKRPEFEQIQGVNVFRVQDRPLDEKGLSDFIRRIALFWFRAMMMISYRHLRRPYDLCHIHNLPDFLVFTAWLPKCMGVRVILDIHDLLPELYVSKFHAAEDGGLFHLLRWVEWCAAKFANHVIIANDLWFEKITNRAVPPSRCTAMVNYIDLRMFHPRERTRSDGKYIVIFPGSLQWHQGLDIAIRAFELFHSKVVNAEFHIYGKGGTEAELRQLVKELRLNGSVKFLAPVDVSEIPGIMANADMGVVPKRADSFGNEAYSTKIMEFMSQSVPVVVSKTKIDNFYFNDQVVRFFESGNAADLASGMIEVARNRELRDRLIANSLAYVRVNSWDTQSGNYLALVDSLSGRRGATTVGAKTE